MLVCISQALAFVLALRAIFFSASNSRRGIILSSIIIFESESVILTTCNSVANDMLRDTKKPYFPCSLQCSWSIQASVIDKTSYFISMVLEFCSLSCLPVNELFVGRSQAIFQVQTTFEQDSWAWHPHMTYLFRARYFF